MMKRKKIVMEGAKENNKSLLSSAVVVVNICNRDRRKMYDKNGIV